ncbi:unnamed protein product [Arabidopsis halleri]
MRQTSPLACLVLHIYYMLSGLSSSTLIRYGSKSTKHNTLTRSSNTQTHI